MPSSTKIERMFLTLLHIAYNTSTVRPQPSITQLYGPLSSPPYFPSSSITSQQGKINNLNQIPVVDLLSWRIYCLEASWTGTGKRQVCIAKLNLKFN